MAARKAASVLPDPVGAAISTCRPAWKAGHACSCAAVGAAKLRSNQAATAGWNNDAGVMGHANMRGFAAESTGRRVGKIARRDVAMKAPRLRDFVHALEQQPIADEAITRA